MSETIIETNRLCKEFVRDEFHVVALKDVTLSIDKGEYVVLMGPSGSGKSTLLHLIAAMDRPSSGTMKVLGHSLGDMSDRELAHWRNVSNNGSLSPASSANDLSPIGRFSHKTLVRAKTSDLW